MQYNTIIQVKVLIENVLFSNSAVTEVYSGAHVRASFIPYKSWRYKAGEERDTAMRVQVVNNSSNKSL